MQPLLPGAQHVLQALRGVLQRHDDIDRFGNKLRSIAGVCSLWAATLSHVAWDFVVHFRERETVEVQQPAVHLLAIYATGVEPYDVCPRWRRIKVEDVATVQRVGLGASWRGSVLVPID